MANSKAGLTYHQLRAIVIALYNQGVMMRQPGLTFSHGNTGNEFIALAGELDVVVRDSEPYKKYYLFEAEQFDKDEEFRRGKDKQNWEVIGDLQQFVRDVAKAIGKPFVTTDDVLLNVNSLAAEVGRLQHINQTLLDREKKDAPKPRTKRRAERRVANQSV